MMKFKTNIRCASCVATVTAPLNEVAGEGNWKVDLTDPSRTLTIDKIIDEQILNSALAKVGYKAEKIKDFNLQ